jgi:staphylococcal nuclease domain-containing protein 1
VTVELEFADKKGGWFGQLFIGGKDFALDLLYEGYAQVQVWGNKVVNDLERYEDMEEEAKAEKVGIWGKGMTMITDAGSKNHQNSQAGEKIKVELTDLVDATRFHCRKIEGSKIEAIESAMGQFDPSSAGDLEKPIKRGTLCAAKFDQDDCWYRAKVGQTQGKGIVEV